MDGWHRMHLDDIFQIRQAIPFGLGFAPGLAGLGFQEKKCYSTYSIPTAILIFPAFIHTYLMLGITARLFQSVIISSRRDAHGVHLPWAFPKYMV